MQFLRILNLQMSGSSGTGSCATTTAQFGTESRDTSFTFTGEIEGCWVEFETGLEERVLLKEYLMPVSKHGSLGFE